MPTRREDETHDDFIERCIPIVIDEGTAESPEQAVAVCESMWEAEVSENRSARFVSMAAGGAEIRTATYEDREHMVVPVVMLIGDAVIRAVNSPVPELVPADELAKVPGGWNGRPVLPDHPDGGAASANDPRTLERMRFGQLFGVEFKDNKLRGEAWIDVARARALGGDPERVVERLGEGEMVEISVGAFVTTRRARGISNGRRYEAVWGDIVPDHLAMLPEGTTGACSNEMGCGAPRVNRGHEEVPMTETRTSALLRLLERIGWRKGQDEGTSDVELRGQLWPKLHATVPGFEFIEAVFPDDQMVVYVAWPEESAIMLRRSYSISDDGEVELGDDEVEVRQEQSYVPVAAESGDGATCSCGGRRAAVDDDNDGGGDAPKEEPQMTDEVKALINRIVGAEASPFGDECRDKLAAFGVDQLAALAERFDPTPATAPAEPAPETTQPPAELTEEEAIAQLPASLRGMLAKYQAEEKRRHASLVSRLKDKQNVHDEAALRAMSVDELQNVARLLRLDEPVDFSAARIEGASANDDDQVPGPPDLTEAIRAARTA